MNVEPTTQDAPETTSARRIGGAPVVIGIFTFATVITGVLWIYWYYHTAPFIPLQKAIAAEFPGSAPRVDGGQRRMHKSSPRLLWIVMKTEIDPESREVDKIADRVIELARNELDLSEYEQVNIRLFRGDPEKTIRKRDFEIVLDQ